MHFLFSFKKIWQVFKIMGFTTAFYTYISLYFTHSASPSTSLPITPPLLQDSLPPSIVLPELLTPVHTNTHMHTHTHKHTYVPPYRFPYEIEHAVFSYTCHFYCQSRQVPGTPFLTHCHSHVTPLPEVCYSLHVTTAHHVPAFTCEHRRPRTSTSDAFTSYNSSSLPEPPFPEPFSEALRDHAYQGLVAQAYSQPLVIPY